MSMRIAGGVVLLAVGLVLAYDKKDLEAFQGKWELASSEKDGKKLATGATRTVKDSTYALEKDGKTLGKGSFKLDSSASPKAIDITREGAKAVLGIYAIDGDEQKVCFAPEGKERPKEFTSKDGNTLSVWKKAK